MLYKEGRLEKSFLNLSGPCVNGVLMSGSVTLQEEGNAIHTYSIDNHLPFYVLTKCHGSNIHFRFSIL